MRASYKYKDSTIEFDIEYRLRKSISIQIRPSMEVKVLSPKGLSRDKIIDAVMPKSKWILDKLKELKSTQKYRQAKVIEDGACLYFKGKEVYLKINQSSTKRSNVALDNGFLTINAREEAGKEELKDLVVDWYKQRATDILIERVRHYQGYIGVAPTLVKAKEQKRRWGTATSQKRLYFNWKLIMAPLEIIDYVVVHEMCHLKEMNHSKSFWSLVEKVMPDYKSRRQWLKVNGYRLSI